jgi:hypothetical protein
VKILRSDPAVVKTSETEEPPSILGRFGFIYQPLSLLQKKKHAHTVQINPVWARCPLQGKKGSDSAIDFPSRKHQHQHKLKSLTLIPAKSLK